VSVSLLLVAFAAFHPHESLPPVEPARPRTALARYVSDADYPPSALHARQEGTVAFVLAVNPDGRVGGCTVSASSGSAALDNATCSIMRRRARFTPARDANGNVVADTFSSRFAWTLPRPPQPNAQ
jgi:protein TonB